MPLPEPFSPIEREYYAGFKALVREHTPSGRQLLADLHTAYEHYFQTEGIILSRRERYRLFLLIMEEVLAELEAELNKLSP
jgi:metallophosphoesterase superfamily enzyme